MARITVTHFTDPACPFAYSATPALAVLHWRYGEQLDWRLVTIGIAASLHRYVEAGYTPAAMAAGVRNRFRRFGMPLTAQPRSRIVASSRACRAIHAARRLHPGREEQVLRALQFGWFTTTLLMDEDDDIATALSRVEEVDGATVTAAIDDPEIVAAYEQDMDETRQAQGSATEFQGKARQTDGPVRYSAPSLVFESDGHRLEAGGFQPVDAYDVLIANLDPSLERVAPPEEPLEALARFPGGLVPQEVAAIMAQNNQAPDRSAAASMLIERLADGAVRRIPLGDDALWQLA